ncbi:GGDEF domain-containing protein [Solicola sp. PLA-1-18]
MASVSGTRVRAVLPFVNRRAAVPPAPATAPPSVAAPAGPSVWHTRERANTYGAAGVALFSVVAVLTSWATGEITSTIVAGAAAWVVMSAVVWAGLRESPPRWMLIWPVLLSLSTLGLSLVSPTAAALLVGAQTLGFVFAGQTNPPGWFVVLLPIAWVAAWLSFGLPVRETLIRLSIATLIWAVCAEIPARLLRKLQHLATTDPLTGLSNRAELNRAMAELTRDCAADSVAPALVLIDLDHFKAYNDTHGHLGGDELLRAFGDCIRANTRRNDRTYRFGGEEFLLVFDQVGQQQAAVLVQRLRTAWARHPSGSTFSAGIATALSRADECLYEAKAAGRNTTVVARAEQPV